MTESEPTATQRIKIALERARQERHKLAQKNLQEVVQLAKQLIETPNIYDIRLDGTPLAEFNSSLYAGMTLSHITITVKFGNNEYTIQRRIE